jgi:hypothetical protein
MTTTDAHRKMLTRTAIGTALAGAILFAGPAALSFADPPPPPGPSSSVTPRNVVVPDASEDGDLYMIELQDQVNQRQRAVQLTQQMLEQMNQTTKDVMKNCPTCFGP